MGEGQDESGVPDEAKDEQRRRRARDQAIVDRVLAGDGAAFGELFESYREKVYATAFNYVRDKQDALDITQDAFVKAFEKLPSFKSQASFYTWITQIAINLAIDHGRKRKRRKTIGLEEEHIAERPATGERPPLARVIDDETHRHYEAALAELSEKHKTVFVLHTVEELAYKEIADVLQISIGTVMSRLHYARKRLQGLLKDVLRPRGRRGSAAESGSGSDDGEDGVAA